MFLAECINVAYMRTMRCFSPRRNIALRLTRSSLRSAQSTIALFELLSSFDFLLVNVASRVVDANKSYVINIRNNGRLAQLSHYIKASHKKPRIICCFGTSIRYVVKVASTHFDKLRAHITHMYFIFRSAMAVLLVDTLFFDVILNRSV